jgi:hypothetical protein
MKATFKRNPARPDVYDLQETAEFPFTFCRVSRPRTDWLMRQGAIWVLESWVHNQKAVFTGLRPLPVPGHYKGDILLNAVKHRLRIEHEPGDPVISIIIQRPRKRVKIALK